MALGVKYLHYRPGMLKIPLENTAVACRTGGQWWRKVTVLPSAGRSSALPASPRAQRGWWTLIRKPKRGDGARFEPTFSLGSASGTCAGRRRGLEPTRGEAGEPPEVTEPQQWWWGVFVPKVPRDQPS